MSTVLSLHSLHHLTRFIRFACRTTIFVFANLLLYPSECNTLCTVFWLKVFVLHSFSFAVMSCKVRRLLLLIKRFKALLSQARIQDFFRRGCTSFLLYYYTNKSHSFFFCKIPVVLENRRSFRGGGMRTPCTLPLDPSLYLYL